MEGPPQITPSGLADYLDVMSKAVFQSGMSCRVVEAKWAGTPAAFHGFDPARLIDLTPHEVGRLDGRAPLGTGAWRGRGRGIALALARAGAKVVVNALGTSLSGEGTETLPADQVADEILTNGGEAVTNRGNVARFDDATEMV